jgi:pullulanase/glycogen debranching enzyme
MNNKQELTDSAINQILDNIDDSKLSEWEKEFVTSVRAYWKKNKKLSDKQKKRLSELWEKQHSPKESK